MARQEGLRTFFDALSASLDKPVILSKAAARRTISGDFSMVAPQQTLERVVRQMGLIWYSDGQTLYVYEAAEAKSAVISLNTITVHKLDAFLRSAGLRDTRYPLRHDGLRTFYVSGPPAGDEAGPAKLQSPLCDAATFDSRQRQSPFVCPRPHAARHAAVLP